MRIPSWSNTRRNLRALTRSKSSAQPMPPPPIPPKPPVQPNWPIPKLNLRVEDMSHEGADIFFRNVNAATVLRDAVLTSFQWLYTLETVPNNVQNLLLVLRPMAGVAHTFGSQTDKEIHLSLDHIKNSASRARDEILGVITHEVVHCFQYNGKDKCPGGLIEGIADFVRLRAGFGPPHWNPSRGDKWDAGYEKTAYFLDWIERRYGPGTIRELNGTMKDKMYDEKIFKVVTGRRVDKLWKLYCESIG